MKQRKLKKKGIRHTTLSEIEVKRYKDIKSKSGFLQLEDELKIIKSFGFDVEVICLGAYFVLNWESIVIDTSELTDMFTECVIIIIIIILPYNDVYKSRIYGIITRAYDKDAYTLIDKIEQCRSEDYVGISDSII